MADSPLFNTDGPLGLDIKIGGSPIEETFAVTEVRVCEGISRMPQLRLCIQNPIDLATSDRAGDFDSFITNMLDQPITVDPFYGSNAAFNIFTGQVTHLGDVEVGDASGSYLHSLYSDVHELQSYGVFGESQRSFRTIPEFYWKDLDTSGQFHLVIGGGHDKLESLQRNRRCRVFEEQTYADIISAVLSEHGITATVDGGPTDVLNFVVQYQESDYNFVLRMMQEAGLVYTSLEDGTVDVFQLDDSAAADWTLVTGVDVYAAALIKARDLDLTSKVAAFDPATKSVQEAEATGTDVAKGKINSAGELAGDFFELLPEMVDRYPSTALMDQLAKTASGVRDAYGALGLIRIACPGNNIRPGMVLEYDSRTLVAHAVEHVLKDGMYTCIVTAGIQGQPVHSVQQPHIPRIHGPQTALVVEDVDPEALNYNRVKVEFCWPNAGEQGTNSQSAWVRVVQPWGGADRGTSFVPQVDDEVIVEFLNGDPSCPIVTGSVYNGTSAEPYPIETSGDPVTAIKTISNELKFVDTSGEEYAELASKNEVHHSIREPASEPSTATALVKLNTEEILIQHTEKPINLKADADAIDVTASQAVNITSESSTITIEASTSLTLKVGGNEIVIDASGVTISGTLVNIN